MAIGTFRRSPPSLLPAQARHRHRRTSLRKRAATTLLLEPRGLLTRFIDQRLAAYVEQKRDGRPQPERVSFSRKQYAATLLALTKLSVAQQARHLEISEQELSVWRTQRPFKSQAWAHAQAFAGMIRETARVASSAIDIWLDALSLGEIAEGPSDVTVLWPAEGTATLNGIGPEGGADVFGDVELYGGLIREALWETELDIMPLLGESDGDPRLWPEWQRVVWRVVGARIAAGEPRVRRVVQAYLARFVAEKLQAPDWSERTRKEALWAQRQLIHLIEQQPRPADNEPWNR